MKNMKKSLDHFISKIERNTQLKFKKQIHFLLTMSKIEHKQKKLFFIVGVGRSGTSLLQELMCTFSGFCNKKESKVGGPRSMTCWTPVRKSNDFSYLEKFIEKNWTSEFFVEKTPDSILCIPEIIRKYPEANYIFLLRNPSNIVLSQLNLFPVLSEDFLERMYHIKNLITPVDDLTLPPEQYWAKFTHSQISKMVKNSKLSSNKIILKYEHLTNSLDYCLELLEKKFGIQKNKKLAYQVIQTPSYSSKNNKHKIRVITDKRALRFIQEAQKLLNYN